MTNLEIIILSLSIAFCWIDVNQWLKFKPFNCMMCMTGWIALTLGVFTYGLWGNLLFPVGCFAGAMFEAIKYRYL